MPFDIHKTMLTHVDYRQDPPKSPTSHVHTTPKAPPRSHAHLEALAAPSP